MGTGVLEPRLPTEDERNLARQSSEKLARFRKPRNVSVRVEDGKELIPIPLSAFKILSNILAEMARGNAVTYIPIHAELTTQQAANLLNISRPFLIKLLKSGKIAFHLVGSHRRIKFKDLMSYKQKIDGERRKAFREITAESQDLGLEY